MDFLFQSRFRVAPVGARATLPRRHLSPQMPRALVHVRRGVESRHGAGCFRLGKRVAPSIRHNGKKRVDGGASGDELKSQHIAIKPLWPRPSPVRTNTFLKLALLLACWHCSSNFFQFALVFPWNVPLQDHPLLNSIEVVIRFCRRKTGMIRRVTRWFGFRRDGIRRKQLKELNCDGPTLSLCFVAWAVVGYGCCR